MSTCVEEKRQLVDLGHEQLSIVRQRKLIGMARSSWYATGGKGESADNPALMGEIDRIYTVRPFSIKYSLSRPGADASAHRCRTAGAFVRSSAV